MAKKFDGDFKSQSETSFMRIGIDDGKVLELAKTLGDFTSVREVVHNLILAASATDGDVLPEPLAKTLNVIRTAQKTVKGVKDG